MYCEKGDKRYIGWKGAKTFLYIFFHSIRFRFDFKNQNKDGFGRSLYFSPNLP